MAGFTRIARCDEIPPGEGKAFTIGNRSVAVFNVGGSFHAIDNTCPHMGAPLAAGYLDGHLIVCPWHAWTFDVRDGCFAMHPEAGVDSFPLEIENGEILVEVPSTKTGR